MLLIGSLTSPFVRRVAVTMKLYGLSFEHRPYATDRNMAEISTFNPLGRIPALAPDDGEVIIDSTMIIDYLDEIMGPDKALTPRSGPSRRQVNRIIALALGTADKYVAAYYERTKRPESHVWQPRLERVEDQIRSGLQALCSMAQGPWFLGEALTQADVTVVAALEAMRFDMPHLAPPGRFTQLDKLAL